MIDMIFIIKYEFISNKIIFILYERNYIKYY